MAPGDSVSLTLSVVISGGADRGLHAWLISSAMPLVDQRAPPWCGVPVSLCLCPSVCVLRRCCRFGQHVGHSCCCAPNGPSNGTPHGRAKHSSGLLFLTRPALTAQSPVTGDWGLFNGVSTGSASASLASPSPRSTDDHNDCSRLPGGPAGFRLLAWMDRFAGDACRLLKCSLRFRWASGGGSEVAVLVLCCLLSP